MTCRITPKRLLQCLCIVRTAESTSRVVWISQNLYICTLIFPAQREKRSNGKVTCSYNLVSGYSKTTQEVVSALCDSDVIVVTVYSYLFDNLSSKSPNKR